MIKNGKMCIFAVVKAKQYGKEAIKTTTREHTDF